MVDHTTGSAGSTRAAHLQVCNAQQQHAYGEAVLIKAIPQQGEGVQGCVEVVAAGARVGLASDI